MLVAGGLDKIGRPHTQVLKVALTASLRVRPVRCGAAWCSVVHRGAVRRRVLQCVAVFCSMVQCSAVCFSAAQCGAVWCSMVQYGAAWCSVLQTHKSAQRCANVQSADAPREVCCSALQRVAVRCSALQCIAV